MSKLGEDMERNVSVSQRIDQGVLRWFRYVERMRDERMAKRMYESDVRRVRRRGRPGWSKRGVSQKGSKHPRTES